MGGEIIWAQTDSVVSNVYSGGVRGQIIIIIIMINNKYSWTLCHSISAIDHASLDGAV